MWDIKGKKLGVPVWQLLGGKVRDKVKVYGWIGGDTPDAVVEGALLRIEQGFSAVKMNGTGWHPNRLVTVPFIEPSFQVLLTGSILLISLPLLLSVYGTSELLG